MRCFCYINFSPWQSLSVMANYYVVIFVSCQSNVLTRVMAGDMKSSASHKDHSVPLWCYGFCVVWALSVPYTLIIALKVGRNAYVKIDMFVTANLAAPVRSAPAERHEIEKSIVHASSVCEQYLFWSTNSSKHNMSHHDETAGIFGFSLRNRNDVESLVSSSTRFREFKESSATQNPCPCMCENYEAEDEK